MRFVIGFVFAILSIGSATGCVSSTQGNQSLAASKVNLIQKGVTTRAEVEKLLGSPDNIAMMGDGRRMMMYSGAQTASDHGGDFLSSVPLVGSLVPTENKDTVTRQVLQIVLNQNDVVEDYEYSNTATETNTTTSAFGGHVDQKTTPVDSSK
jgi:outer membrane protein assembly factor BamE (lipoprotein component of BamABCDE complex)